MAAGSAAGGLGAFSPRDVALAGAGAMLVEAGLFALAVAAGASSGQIKPHEAPPPEPIPISVTPVIDDTPLLKLGGKVKTKLPDMWKKQPPVQRFEESSAPSTKASKSPDAIPTSKLAKDAAAPPPDAEVAKQVDQVLLDATPDTKPTVQGEGSPDGVKEGTETDPLKARAVSQYRAKIIAWFNARFKSPTKDEIPCEELTKLRAAVSANVGGDRSVASFSVGRPSGNALFDARVQSTMQGTIGAELPPPPPLYPDILSTAVSLTFAGRDEACKAHAADDSQPKRPEEPKPQPAEEPKPKPADEP